MKKEKKTNAVWIYVLLVTITLMSIFPFLWMLSSSFNSDSNIFAIPPKMIPDMLFKTGMFNNYLTVLTEFNFALFTGNSLFVSILCAAGQILVCSLAGFAFAKMRFRGKNLIFSFLLVTLMIPVQVTIIPEYFLMMKLNWIDTYLPLIIPSFLAGAFGTFMYKEFFELVPDALFDAGIIDGVTSRSMFFRIYLPLSASPSVTLFIIAFMNAWNDLLRPMLYLSSDNMQTVTLALTQFQSQYNTRWNLLLAGSVISILPLLILFVFCQRYIIENSMGSGVKG
jgi:multiple sugar transport system permease protein